MWIFIYDTTTGLVKSETTRAIEAVPPGFAIYNVPESLQGPNGEQLWLRTHDWDPRLRELAPKPPEVKSQDRLDAERILTDGIASETDRDRLLLLVAKRVLRPERM